MKTDFEFFLLITLFLGFIGILLFKFSNWLKVMYGHCIFVVLVVSSYFDSLRKKINNFPFFVSFLGNVIYPFLSSINYNTTKAYLFFKSKILVYKALDQIYTNPEPITKEIIEGNFEPKYSENLIKLLINFKDKYQKYNETEYWHQIYFGENAVLGNILKSKIQNFESNKWDIEIINKKLNFLKHQIHNDFKTWNLDTDNLPFISLAIEKLDSIKLEMTKKLEPTPIQVQEIAPQKVVKPTLNDYFKNPNNIELFDKSIGLLKNTEFEGFKTKNLPENYYILLYNIFEELNFFNEKWPSIRNNKKRKLELLDPIFGKTISRGFVNDLMAEYEPNNPENKIYSTQLLMKEEVEKMLSN